MQKTFLTGVSAAVLLLSSAAFAADEAPQGEWFGTVEAGLHIASGNTESEDLNAAVTLGYNQDRWTHSLSARVLNKKENDVRTNEEYRFGAGTRYDLSDVDFLFGEAEYVNDRFGGFEYRISEVVGYGRQWYDSADFTWSSSVGAGMQHTKTTTGVKEDSALGRIANDITWQITDSTAFENHIRLDIADINILRTETSIKNALSESLFLKVGFETESLSEVPAGRKKTDTDTLVNVVYEY